MIEIKDVSGLSKPLTRLIEVISEGIGAVSRPYLTKKNSEAKAHEIRVIAAALNDVAEQHHLPVIYKRGSIETWQKPDDSTLALEPLPAQDRTALRVDYQERKRQKNLENITSIAATELANEQDVPVDKPDEDWTTRFFSSAQDVSSEQMQNLWGRILAGEIKRPGSYSLKTLDFIRNITKADALILEHIGRLAVEFGDTTFVAAQNKKWLQDRYQVFPGHHFALSELGALYPTDLNLRVFREDSIQEQAFISGEMILLVKRGDIKSEIPLPIWKFTVVGRELLALVPNAQDESYLESLGMFFVERKGTAFLAKLTERLPDGRIGYNTIREISAPIKQEEVKGEA